jgi:peptidoglycan/xylan/chitin deacetylase (PgdA/CDA1 family)
MNAFLAILAVTLVNVAALAPAPARVPAPVSATAQAQAPDANALDDPRYDQVWRVHTARKEIALTFDDGPYPFYTPVLLHVLERSHAPATFFIVGRSAQEFPELVARIVDSGDEIGNHTFNHYTLTALSDTEIAYQIAADGAFLEQFTGKPLSLFRPPHGHCNAHIVAIARDLGYRTILWSDAANDVKDIAPDVIAQRVETEASPGGIILLHSGQYRTIEALPRIIDRLRAQGYTFVTVTKLLDDGGAP